MLRHGSSLSAVRERRIEYELSYDRPTGAGAALPGFQKMLTAIEAGYISAVFVKNLSRLGRNYIEVGKLTEEFFPLHDIRLVAVSDGVDSEEGEDDFTPFKNIMNKYYAKDISKKRRIYRMALEGYGWQKQPPALPPMAWSIPPTTTRRKTGRSFSMSMKLSLTARLGKRFRRSKKGRAAKSLRSRRNPAYSPAC